MSLALATQIAGVVGVLVAVFAFGKGLIEYRSQGLQRRAEHFVAMRRRFKENAAFNNIRELLEIDSPDLQVVSFLEKIDFLGFFEEIALLMNSGLLRKEVVHYMVGYYAIRCWQSDHFWHGINRDGIYWSLFREFAKDMESMENSFQFDIQKLRF